MSTPNTNIEIFNTQGEIFPSFSSSKVKTTELDYYFTNGDVLPFLLQPAQASSSPSGPTTTNYFLRAGGTTLFTIPNQFVLFAR